MSHAKDPCPHCKRCRTCDYCDCCGKCRACGQARPAIDWSQWVPPAAPQIVPMPYPVPVSPPIYPYGNWPNTGITWGTSGDTAVLDPNASGATNGITLTSNGGRYQ